MNGSWFNVFALDPLLLMQIIVLVYPCISSEIKRNAIFAANKTDTHMSDNSSGLMSTQRSFLTINNSTKLSSVTTENDTSEIIGQEHIGYPNHNWTADGLHLDTVSMPMRKLDKLIQLTLLTTARTLISDNGSKLKSSITGNWNQSNEMEVSNNETLQTIADKQSPNETSNNLVFNKEITTRFTSTLSTDQFGGDNFISSTSTSNVSITTSPIVYFDFRRQCPDENVSYIWWNRTFGGVIAVRYCPFGYSGKAFRMCYHGGTWGDVDCSECRILQLIKLKHLIYQHVHKNITEGLHHLSEELLGILQRYQLHSIDDYLESFESLNLIVNAKISLNFNFGENFKFVKAVLKISDILFSKFDSRWPISQEKQDVMTMRLVQVLHGMTHFSTLVADGILKNSQNLVIYTNYPHIGLEAKVIQCDEDYWISPPNTKSSLYLPTSSCKIAGLFKKLVVITMWYDDITGNLQEEGVRVKSIIFSTTLHSEENLRKKDVLIIATFEISEILNEDDVVKCGFLQHDSNRSSLWSSDDCTVTSVRTTSVTCTCHNMDIIAAVIYPKYHKLDGHGRPVSAIVFIGCVISLVLLLLTFIAHLQILRREPSESLLIVSNLIFSMITAEVVFMVGIQATNIMHVCEGVSIVLHYIYLVSSFWLLSHSIHVYITTQNNGLSTSEDHIKDYCLLSWIVPIMLVVITFAVNPKGYETRKYCWLSIERGMLISYIVPIFCLITVNTTLMVLALKHLLETQMIMKKSDLHRTRISVRASVILLPYHGVHWFFGVLAMEDRSTDIFQTIFGITTALQGLLIFLFYGIPQAEVRKVLGQLWRKLLTRQKKSISNRSQRRAKKIDSQSLLAMHESVMGGSQDQLLNSSLAAQCLHVSEVPFTMAEERFPVS